MEIIAGNLRDSLDDVSDDVAMMDFFSLFNELQSQVFSQAAIAKTNRTFISEPRITGLNYNENRCANIYTSQVNANYRITFSDGFQINMPSLDSHVLARAKNMFNNKMLELEPKRRLHLTLNR